MRLRSARVSKLSLYIIIFSISTLFLMIVFFILTYFYPIPSVTNNFSNTKHSFFITPWPISALETEMLERKRLKRYARSEQARRMEKQLQKMEMLNVPIYDLFQDPNAELVSFRYANNTEGNSFLWPVLPTSRYFYNTLNYKYSRNINSILFPFTHWTRVSDAMLLLAGEEIKATIPLVKERRSFSFSLFLITPGSLRISLGQYVWAKTFTEEEVQKKIKISIPINDSTATNIRIINVSASCYIMNAFVNHVEYNARTPIKVSSNSKLWSPQKNLILSTNEAITETEATDTDLDDDTSQNSSESDKQIPPDELKNEELKQEDINNLMNNLDKKTVLPDKNKKNLDPLTQTTNMQMISDKDITTAFGYNILFIHSPKIPEEIIKNKKLFSKIAPHIYNLYENSFIFENNIETNNSSISDFRQIIFPAINSFYENNNPILIDKINNNKQINVYKILRKYGYNVIGIAHPEAFYYTDGIIDNKGFSSIYGRWLEKNDWSFANKNSKLDDRNAQISGLDAIFNTSVKSLALPILNNDFSLISNYLKNVSKNIYSVPEWNPNEYLLIDKKDLYIPRVLDSFQIWTQEYQQSRFFAHILLNSEKEPINPSLKELGKAIINLGFSSFIKPKYINMYAEISYLDKSISQILDTLKARKVENRTILFLLLPKSNNKYSYGFFKIPGLIPKQIETKAKFDLNEIIFSLLETIGLPENTLKKVYNYRHFEKFISNHNLSDLNSNYINSEKVNYKKFHLILKQSKNNCSKFTWKSKAEKILEINSKYPIFQLLNNDTIEFFPCSIKEPIIEITWYQKENIEKNVNNLDSYLGGYFLFQKENKNIPKFFFGKNMVQSDNSIFYLENIKENSIRDIFFVNNSDTDRVKDDIIVNLKTNDGNTKKSNKPLNLNDSTLISFFVSDSE